MSISRPSVIVRPFGLYGSRNAIPFDSQIGITDGAASYNDGFPPGTMLPEASGGIAPDGKDFNGILYDLSAQLRFVNAGGQPRFDASLAAEVGGYPVGAVLQDDTGLKCYINIIDGNTTNFNTTPSSIGVSWIPYSPGMPGQICYFARNTAPHGFLKANGAPISRTAYSVLFAAIGTVFGVGDGSTTFNLPDIRGEFIRGWDDARGIDAARVFGSKQTDAFKAHTHSTTVKLDRGSGQMGNALYGDEDYYGQVNLVSGQTGGSETRPRNIALLACIKY